jgi:hypothetical protein
LVEAEAEASAKSPFLGQTEAEAEDSVDHCEKFKFFLCDPANRIISS